MPKVRAAKSKKYSDSAEWIRRPVAAGIFYPRDRSSLTDLLDQLLGRKKTAVSIRQAAAVLVPHGVLAAGAGKVAADVFAGLEIPESAVVLSANHSGVGKAFSLAAAGDWVTPLGTISVDESLAKAIRKASPDLSDDSKVQQDEHGVELLLPFLQRMEVRSFVPVLLRAGHWDACVRIAEGLADAIRLAKRKVLLVISTNLCQYEPQDVVKEKDARALERILKLDARGLLQDWDEGKVSLCGITAVVVGLLAAKRLSATEGKLIRYEIDCSLSEGSLNSYGGHAGIVF